MKKTAYVLFFSTTFVRMGSKARVMRTVGNLTAICEPILSKISVLDVSQPYGTAWPVIRITLPFLLLLEKFLAQINM
jgi:hypothetical protein